MGIEGVEIVGGGGLEGAREEEVGGGGTLDPSVTCKRCLRVDASCSAEIEGEDEAVDDEEETGIAGEMGRELLLEDNFTEEE